MTDTCVFFKANKCTDNKTNGNLYQGMRQDF